MMWHSGFLTKPLTELFVEKGITLTQRQRNFLVSQVLKGHIDPSWLVLYSYCGFWSFLSRLWINYRPTYYEPFYVVHYVNKKVFAKQRPLLVFRDSERRPYFLFNPSQLIVAFKSYPEYVRKRKRKLLRPRWLDYIPVAYQQPEAFEFTPIQPVLYKLAKKDIQELLKFIQDQDNIWVFESILIQLRARNMPMAMLYEFVTKELAKWHYLKAYEFAYLIASCLVPS